VSVDASPNHQVKLSSGGSTFRIMGMGKDEFPPLPEFGDEKAHTLQQSELAAMLKSVSYAQSQDETRYTLNGVYFNFKEGSLTLVATDGRRLALVSKDMEVPASGTGAIILPAKTVERAHPDPRQGRQGEDQLQRPPLCVPDRDRQGRQRAHRQRLPLLEGGRGQLPELPAGDPKETHQRIKLERELLLQCVHRAALVCSEKSNSVQDEADEQPPGDHGAEPGFRRGPRVDGDRLQRPRPAGRVQPRRS
jgi:DNA polymerase-3 subunit beta